MPDRVVSLLRSVLLVLGVVLIAGHDDGGLWMLVGAALLGLYGGLGDRRGAL